MPATSSALVTAAAPATLPSVGIGGHNPASKPEEECMAILATPPPKANPDPTGMVTSGEGSHVDTMTGEAMAMCIFDCGGPRPLSTMTNTATHANPRWMCPPCNGARKAIEFAAKGNPDTQLQLQQLKKNDPELWKQKVRACRIRPSDDPVGAPGVDTLGSRRAAIHAFAATLTQRVSVQDIHKRKYFNKKSFIAFLKYKAGERVDTPEEEDRWWSAALDNPDIIREGNGEDTHILVDCGHTLQGIRERAVEASVSRSTGLTSMLEVEEAMVRVTGTGAGQGALFSQALGSAGDPFRPGAAASSSGHATVSPGILADKGTPPSATTIVPAEDFAPFGTDSGGLGKRGLEACLEDPANPTQGKKARAGPKKPRAGFATGDLWDAQEASRQRVKELKTRFETCRNNLAKKVSAMRQKDPTLVSQSLLEMATRYTHLLQLLGGIRQDTANWTWSTMAEGQANLDDVAKQLQVLAEDMGPLVNEAKEEARKAVSKRTADHRAALGARERLVKPYVAKGTPGVLVRWLYEVDAFDLLSELLKPPQPGQPPVNEPSPNATGQRAWCYGQGLKWDIPDGMFSADTLAIWSPKANGLGEHLRKLPLSYGHRLQPSQDKMLAYLQGQQGQPDGATMGVLRMPPKGQPTDSVEALSWAPPTWKEKGWVPEALRTFGSPWLLVGQPGSCRVGASGWAMPGMGQFLAVLSGSAYLVTFPYSEAMERGAEMANAHKWLLETTGKVFATFAGKAIRAAAMSTGCTAWVPYGWAAILLTTVTHGTPSLVMSAPYLNHALAKQYAWLGVLVKHNVDVVTALQRSGHKPWDTLAPSYLEWLGSLQEGPEHGQPGQKTQDALLALENGSQGQPNVSNPVEDSQVESEEEDIDPDADPGQDIA